MSAQQGLPIETVKEWMADFGKDKVRLIAQKACTQFETLSILADRSQVVSHVFNTKVHQDIKPVTDQKSSGRCWIYATLNILRLYFCKKYNMEECELSQTYVYFWDKVERCNYMLGAFIKLAQEGATNDDRTLSHLLTNPTNDGGQWQMVVNIIEKYGLIPHRHWRSPYLAENSRRLGLILDNQLRTHCATLMSMVKGGASQTELENARMNMMQSLFNLISTCLGSPPSTFEYDFYDKEKNYVKLGPMTPLEFYQQIMKPLCNLENMVCLTNDPRPTSQYYRLYTVAYLNNMDNAGKVVYVNLPISELKKYARISIENGQAVWFGCDIGKEHNRKDAVVSLDQFDYQAVLGINIRGIDKASRLLYKESEMTHAMAFTGCNIEEKDGEKHVTKWKVENSWGESKNDGKGYLVMTDGWFTEHMFEVVIDKSHLPTDVLQVLEQTPVELPAWDPMGALAKSSEAN